MGPRNFEAEWEPTCDDLVIAFQLPDFHLHFLRQTRPAP